MATQQPDDNRRVWIIVGAIAASVVAIVVGSALRSNDPPPPNEDAYVDAIFTTPEFDWLLPKTPFIEQGYAACELLRSGSSEEQATLIMWGRDTTTGGVPEEIRERYRRQTVAAHQHLCPDA